MGARPTGWLQNDAAAGCSHEHQKLKLKLLGIALLLQHPLPVRYKGLRLDCGYRVDILVENPITLELKSVEQLSAIRDALDS